MSKKTYALVGTWDFRPGEKGIFVFDYNIETAEMTQIGYYDPSVSAGQQYYDPKRNVVYFVDESEGHPGELPGGGYVRAYRLTGEGKLEFINEQCIFMVKPSYVWLDPSGKYAMVSAHGGRNAITKVVYHADGSFGSSVQYEDVGMALLRINEDGSLGEVCDIVLHQGITPLKTQVHAHLHSVYGSADGEIYYACDKGLDMIYSYKIDRERGKLIRMAEKKMDYATAPRYGAFHPALPVFYENNETSNYLFAFHYDKNSGYLSEIAKVSLCEDEVTSPSDVVVSRDGKYLYASIRKVDKIAVFALDEQGIPTKIQEFNSIGSARGLALSPDGRFLLGACDATNEVRAFAIASDGKLEDTGLSVPAAHAANIGIVEIEC